MDDHESVNIVPAGFIDTACEPFSAGIAGAPVTDWRDYDTIYTERFMSTPQENPVGDMDSVFVLQINEAD